MQANQKSTLIVPLKSSKIFFGIEKLLLEGGSIINGAFQQADAVDELSLVVAPVVADKDSKPLFTHSTLSDFSLTNTETEGDVLILKYKKKLSSLRQEQN